MIGGNIIALVFCPEHTAVVNRVLADYRSRLEEMGFAGARFFCVMRARPEATVSRDIPFPVLCDVDGKAFRAFDADTRDRLTTIVLRPNHHVTAIVRSRPKVHAAEALAAVQRLAAERKPTPMALHPPVLIVPEVLTRDECRRLIDVYETRGRVFVQPGPGIDYMGTDYKMRIPEYGRRDRIDHWIVEEDTKAFLRSRLQNRLFPEFGDQRYRPDNGTAFVFSSALVHEAMHVTAGRRLVLLAFLFGDR